MLKRIVLAVLIGIFVYLACNFLGGAAEAVSIAWVASIGGFFVRFAELISFAAALWYFFGGGNPFRA